jgi:hypothetical protein
MSRQPNVGVTQRGIYSDLVGSIKVTSAPMGGSGTTQTNDFITEFKGVER